jgi:hypothetical protein
MTVGTSDAVIMSNAGFYIEQPLILDGGIASPSSGCGDHLCRASSGALVDCGSNTCSSLRYKDNITTYSRGLDVIDRLNPVTFKYKTEPIGARPTVGLIAEEVARIAPEFALFKDGKPEGLMYDKLVGLLVNGIKEQQAQIRALEKRLTGLEARNN